MQNILETIFIISFLLVLTPCALAPLFESDKKKIKRIIAKYNIFFALDSTEYNRQAQQGVEYIRHGCGLICPAIHNNDFMADIHKMNKTDNISEYVRLFTLAQE